MGWIKKILKPVQKLADKIIPNEIAPLVPLAATALGGPLAGMAAGAIMNKDDPLKGAASAGLGSLSMGAMSGGAFGAMSGGGGSSMGNAGSLLNGVFSGGAMAGGGKGKSSGGGSSSDLLGSGLGFLTKWLGDDESEDELMDAQTKAEGAFKPYTDAGNAAQTKLSQMLSSGFKPTDLANDAGYQFQLGEGTKALNRSLGAYGNVFSGEAMKAAQNYSQGLANSYFNDAYNRWASQAGLLANQAALGQDTAKNLASIYANKGNIKANRNTSQFDDLGGILSMAFSSGMFG